MVRARNDILYNEAFDFCWLKLAYDLVEYNPDFVKSGMLISFESWLLLFLDNKTVTKNKNYSLFIKGSK
jgi:hypothetical protein